MEMIIGPFAGPVTDESLARAYPWPAEGRWVRAMMATTLDGTVAGPDGRSGSISSPADRAVLSEVRRLADAVLIGAGTLRSERYRPMVALPDAQQERSRLGLRPAPVVMVVSASLELPWDEDLWAQSTVRPVVVTTQAADPVRLDAARDHADVIALPGRSIEPVPMLASIEAMGLRRIVCEGGPRLLADLARAGLVDEADITISPLLVGGGQITTGLPAQAPSRFALAHAIVHEGFLFNRYLAVRA